VGHNFFTMGKNIILMLALIWNAGACLEKDSSVSDKTGKDEINISVSWDKTLRISESSATIQTIPNPSHARGSSLHDPLWKALQDLEADYVRYSPWGEYPNLKIAALEPPKDGETSWDFSALDPMFADFMGAIGNRPFIMNYQAIPDWMLKSPRSDVLTHEIGSLLRDPTGMELANYFARIVEWYTRGGFRDELGKWHHSGHNYELGYWEILNEPDHESIGMTKELYTALYDVVVDEIKKVSPEMKFMGLSMALLEKAPEWTAYFLNQKNHRPGIPLDLVSYHLYATLPADKNDPDIYPYTVFEQADKHLETIRIADSIRQQLSPPTRVDINESGILFRDVPRGWGRMDGDSIPEVFWNLSAAYFAYIYSGLAHQGIEIIGKSTMWSDPGDWPEVSVLDWKTGMPNARYWVLKLIKENFGPGDRIVNTEIIFSDSEGKIQAQGFVSPDDTRRILIVNKTRMIQNISIPGAAGGRVYFVDQSTGFDPPGSFILENSSMNLNGFGVAVITMPAE
jgi:hypothetical protein